MDNKLSIAVALFAGLVGGLLTRYIAPPPVFAQTQNAQSAHPSELRARRFVLVDTSDETLATFTAEPAATS